MTLRRLLAGMPLAALTALAVHVATTGFDHLPGLGHAPALAGLLGASLLLGALSIVLRATLAPARPSIATKGAGAASLALLGAGGFGFYLALELLEGHGLAGWLPALLAGLPAAAVVLRVARAASGLLRAAGTALAAFAETPLRAAARGFAVAFGRLPTAPAVRAGRAHRGRAPPLLA